MKTIYQHRLSATLPVNIEFDNVTLNRIASLLQARYGLCIHFTTQHVENLRYTGNLHSGDSWEFLLHRIAEELSIKYTMVELRSFELSVFV